MSTATNRLRLAGVGGVAAALAITSLAGAGSAFAVASVTGPATLPNVTQGAANQAAGDVTARFVNNFTTNQTETFTLGNDCSTQPGIDAAVGFATDPTVVLSGPFAAGTDNAGSADSRKPSYTVAVSSSPGCGTAGIKDTVTVTLTQPSAVINTDEFKLALTKVAYNVGKKATGNVTVTAAGVVNGSAPNATIVNKSYTFIPVIAAQEGSSGNTLGTATFTETTAGAYFNTGDNTVTLTLSAGTFTDGVTPTIKVPAGYTVTTDGTTAGTPKTAGGVATYSFHVTGPTTPAKAVVSVSGLKLNAPGGAQTVNATAQVTGSAAATMPVANVLDYNDRSGGSDRYGTAVTVFNDFRNNVGTPNDVVLSGGGLYPDALSANYLAGKLGTGTLLTGATKLPAVTRQAIISAGISTVYITGGTGAVSEGVANEIRSMHVSNNPASPFISVVRLGGADRYATNQAVNEYQFNSDQDTVLLASGNGFADALALGPIAYSNQFPLVLTNGKTIGSTEQAQLNDFSPANIVIAGGTGVVSQAVEDSLRAKGYNVLRLGGLDRTLTAAQVATWASVGVGDATPGTLSAGPNNGMLTDSTVYVTNGMGFADALSAGPLAGALGSVIMPTANATALGQGLASYLGSKTVGGADDGAHVDVLHALGLTGAVSNGVVKDAAAAIGS